MTPPSVWARKRGNRRNDIKFAQDSEVQAVASLGAIGELSMASRFQNRKKGRNHTHAVKPANIRPAGMAPKVVRLPTPEGPAVKPAPEVAAVAAA